MTRGLVFLLGLTLAPAVNAAVDASPNRPTPGPREGADVGLPPENTPAHSLGKFEWARLKTDNPYWNQHAERDQFVIDLMRKQTSLQIGNSWHAVRVGHLNELSAYPFLFAESISPLSDAEATQLAEYLRRGGFLLIDACIRSTVNPDWENYLATQIKTLTRLFPQVRVEPLPPGHPIFSNYFKLTATPPQTRSGTNPAWANGSTEPLRGVFLGDRMIGIVSLSGFQCGLVGGRETATNAVKMVSNIYVYAMTH
jgi:Domain of unknown function (DUF4159)